PSRDARPQGRPLVILHTITRLDRGGSSDCTLLQAIGAARRGHDVTLASGPTDAPSPLLDQARRQRGLRLIEIAALRRDLSPLRDLRALLALARLLRGRRIDIVHTHTSKAGALGRLASALTFGPPVIHQPHGHLFYGYHRRLGTGLVVLAERLLARRAGMGDRVSIEGAWVRPAEFLPALDLFVLASRNEGMGRALVEAMASGLPVVATAVGGMPEVLEEGHAGLLVPPGDPQAIADAITRLSHDPQLAADLARR